MDYSQLNPELWRRIVFEGQQFPPTLMALPVLCRLLGRADKELHGWITEFVDCCGIVRSGAAYDCFRHASRARDLLLENRERILTSIDMDLSKEGFESRSTFRDWMNALQSIMEISARTEDDCEWSAPGRPGEAAIVTKQLDAMRWFMGGQS